MAIFGRGQPHQPIFLRTAQAAAVVAAATLLPIHVFSLAAERQAVPQERRASITFLRNAATQPALVGVGSPIHVVLATDNQTTWRHPAREADVLFLRNPQAAPVVVVTTPKPVVVLAPQLRGAVHGARDADITFLRAPRTNDRGPQIHIVGPLNRQSLVVGRRTAIVVLHNAATQPATVALPQPKVVLVRRRPTAGHVVFARNPQGPPPVVAATGSPIHVALQPRERAIPKGAVLLVRNPQTQPATVAVPPPKVVLAPPLRGAVHGARDADITFLRAPQPTTPAVTTPKPTVVVQPRERAIAKGLVLYVRPSRTSLVPDRLAPQFHVVSTAILANPRHPDRDSDPVFRGRRVIFLRAPTIFARATHPVTVVQQVRPRNYAPKGDVLQSRAPTIFARAAHPVTVVQQVRPRSYAPKGDVLQSRAPFILPTFKAAPFHVILQGATRARHDERGGMVVAQKRGPGLIAAPFVARAVKLVEQPKQARKLQDSLARGVGVFCDGTWFADGTIFADGAIQQQGAVQSTPINRARKLKDV